MISKHQYSTIFLLNARFSTAENPKFAVKKVSIIKVLKTLINSIKDSYGKDQSAKNIGFIGIKLMLVFSFLWNYFFYHTIFGKFILIISMICLLHLQVFVDVEAGSCQNYLLIFSFVSLVYAIVSLIYFVFLMQFEFFRNQLKSVIGNAAFSGIVGDNPAMDHLFKSTTVLSVATAISCILTGAQVYFTNVSDVASTDISVAASAKLNAISATEESLQRQAKIDFAKSIHELEKKGASPEALKILYEHKWLDESEIRKSHTEAYDITRQTLELTRKRVPDLDVSTVFKDN